MSTKITIRYFGKNGSSPELRDMAYWRATAVNLTINDYDAKHPYDANNPNTAGSVRLLGSISDKLWSYGIRRGPRWWQFGPANWTPVETGGVRLDGWDKGYRAPIMVLLEHDPAPEFMVKRQDYGLVD